MKIKLFSVVTVLMATACGQSTTNAQENSFEISSAHRLHQTNADLPNWILEKRPYGCMATLYRSFQAVYDWDENRRVEFRKSVYQRTEGDSNVNAAMRELKEDGLLSDIYRIRYSSEKKRYVASVEKQVINLAKRQGGINYFALSVNGGRHAVLLCAMKTNKNGNWEIYQFDQNTTGFSEKNRVTGQLDAWVTDSRFEYETNWKCTHIELGHLRPKK